MYRTWCWLLLHIAIIIKRITLSTLLFHSHRLLALARANCSTAVLSPSRFSHLSPALLSTNINRYCFHLLASWVEGLYEIAVVSCSKSRAKVDCKMCIHAYIIQILWCEHLNENALIVCLLRCSKVELNESWTKFGWRLKYHPKRMSCQKFKSNITKALLDQSFMFI